MKHLHTMFRRFLFIALFLLPTSLVVGQDPLHQSNAETTIRGISFRFTETSTFDEDRLTQEMATKGPGVFNEWKRKLDFLPFVSAQDFPFDPVELQRDVIRLRRFYDRNGFPNAKVDYPASQFRLSDNSIQVIFTIAEGRPLRVDSVLVSLTSAIYEGLNDRWGRLEERLGDRAGQRYTELERLQMENEVLSLLQDRGYAFATVSSSTQTINDGTIRIVVEANPGPLTTVDHISFEGMERIPAKLLLRELHYKSGDRFSRKQFIQGQQELFGLGLFRLALAEIPEQMADSTVDLRYVVRESKPRFLSVETGFSWETGMSLDSNLRHRNFFGGARQMTGAISFNTGWLASPAGGRSPIKSFSGSLSLRQPYLGTTELSGSLAPFYSWQDDPNLETRFYKFGLNTGLAYELLPFRTISLQHSYGRTVPLIGTNLGKRLDIYDLSLLSLGATIGKVNNFLAPRRGILLRPQIETGGFLKGSDVEFLKARLDGVVYIPVTRRTAASFSFSVGKLIPQGKSKDQLSVDNEFRFDGIRFYAGGSTDVRGWALNQLGPQIAIADTVITASDGSYTVKNAHYEAIGGQAKLSGRFEFRVPFPGLSSAWSLGTFIDGAVLSSKITVDENNRPVLTAEGLPVFEDDGTIRFGDMKFGVGSGIRFQTPVGLMRFDLAYKLNPSDEDLRTPTSVYLFQTGRTDSIGKARFIRRFNFQLSIERSF